MPSVSSLLPDDKASVKRAIPSGNKILTATVARIYYQSNNDWVYSGVQGGLCLVVDKTRGGVWFKVVDLLGTRGIIWEHELPSSTTWSYNQDRGYFHSFASEETNIAFVYADEKEAGEMYKKVEARGKYLKKKTKPAAATSAPSSASKKKKGGKIDKSSISGPSEGSFKHVAHMGYSSESGFSSSGVDPSWQALLDQLGNQGISQKQIMENEGFIRDFVQKSGGPPPVKPEPKKRAPPPAPTSKRKAPPPPPSRMPTTPAPSTPTMPSRPTSSLPPPPSPAQTYTPPPQAYTPPPQTYAPPPARAAPALAPPLPPMVPSRGAVPPPPPPAPPGGAPPPPPAPAGLPEVTPPRVNLLASIQGAGLQNLKKTSSGASDSPPPPPNSAPPPPPARAAPAAMAPAALPAVEESSGGGDLASALAAALSTRKGNMGDSDEEDSEDEWD